MWVLFWTPLSGLVWKESIGKNVEAECEQLDLPWRKASLKLLLLTSQLPNQLETPMERAGTLLWSNKIHVLADKILSAKQGGPHVVELLDWNGSSCHELNGFIPVWVKGRPKIACGLDNLLAVTFTSYPSTAVSSIGCWFKELTEIHFPSKKSNSFPLQSCLENEGATIEPVVIPWPLNYLQALFACQSSSQTSQTSSWKVSLVLDLSERNP